jgi:hypothetical protein
MIILACVILTIKCNHRAHSDHSKIVEKWQGKTIYLPSQMNWKSMGKDTICSELLGSSYKILTYIDSIGCTSCKFQTSKWQAFIDTCRQHQLNVSFLFIIHSANYNELDNSFIAQNFSYPVICDVNNNFYKLNSFPEEPYRTFLLDNDNKVLLIGSPLHNPKIWELYRETISSNNNE